MYFKIKIKFFIFYFIRFAFNSKIIAKINTKNTKYNNHDLIRLKF